MRGHRMRGVAAIVAVMLASGLTAVAPASALVVPDPLQGIGRITAADGTAGSAFGSSVDVDGDVAVIGAPYDDEGGADAGAAYIYRCGAAGWQFEQKIRATTEVPGDRFGIAVAVSGDTIAVGASPDPDTGGGVYIFECSGTTWTQQRILSGPNTGAGDDFGTAVDLSADTVFIGAPGDDIVDTDVGAVYPFTGSGTSWSPLPAWYGVVPTGPPPTPEAGDRFGASLAVSGDLAAVGAPGVDGGRGAAFVFGDPGSGWSEAACVFGQLDVAEDNAFGSSVALAPMGAEWASGGGTLVVGEPGWQPSGQPTSAMWGAASIFRGSSDGMLWEYATGLTAAADGYRLGSAVAVSGDTALVGVPGDGAGRVFVYTYGGSGIIGAWTPAQAITCADAVTGDGLGAALAFDARRALIGAPASDALAADAGAVYAFRAPVTSIYRFYNARSGTHFYTPSAEEADHVIATWPDVFTYEGVAYTTDPSNNPSPLYRFYNLRNGGHFYTASATERDIVIATWPQVFRYEGETYGVWTTAGVNRVQIHRFYNLRNGSHFYTASAEEADHVIATWPAVYHYEGPAFWIGQ